MARARDVPGFNCDEAFAAAAARVVRLRADEVFEHAEGVLDTNEIEHLHDMRVATRRLRAALEVFEPCLPPKRFRKALKRVKSLADALGERRDADVELEFLTGFAAQAPDSDRGALHRLIAEVREEQRRANEALAPRVSAKRLRKLRRRLEELVEGAQG